MRTQQFIAFLTARGDDVAVAADAAEAERRLGFNLDNADLGEPGVEALVHRLETGRPGQSTAPLRHALEAYGDFTGYFKAR